MIDDVDELLAFATEQVKNASKLRHELAKQEPTPGVRYIHGCAQSMHISDVPPRVVLVPERGTKVVRAAFKHGSFYPIKRGIVQEYRTRPTAYTPKPQLMIAREVDDADCTQLDDIDHAIKETQKRLDELRQDRENELRAIAARGRKIRMP